MLIFNVISEINNGGNVVMKRKRYENLDKSAVVSPLKDLFKWRFEKLSKQINNSYNIPTVRKTELNFLNSNRSIPTITWIGHSTFLIQMDGINILTDPVWVKHIGISKRLTPPGLAIDELPPIDIVLISHSHYDHLHYKSLKKLTGNPTYFVPAGLAASFIKKGFTKTIESNWWDEHQFAKLNIVFVPAQHWTRRTIFDSNTSHWGGWIIESQHHTIYFAGDSGYFEGFLDIGNRYEINYCLMGIGSYDPEWFLSMQHVSPEEAVQAHIDTRSQSFIPMHYGTFQLADDTTEEALDRLKAEWIRKKLNKNNLNILKIGETLRMK